MSTDYDIWVVLILQSQETVGRFIASLLFIAATALLTVAAVSFNCLLIVNMSAYIVCIVSATLGMSYFVNVSHNSRHLCSKGSVHIGSFVVVAGVVVMLIRSSAIIFFRKSCGVPTHCSHAYFLAVDTSE